MTTDAMTDGRRLADFDEATRRERRGLIAEGLGVGELAGFDAAAAADRAELAAELAAIDDEEGPGDAPATFSVAAPAVTFCDAGCPTPGDPAEMVPHRGLIFRAGHYDDKDFSMSPGELAEAARRFTGPVPIRLDHKDVPYLDGRLGSLESVELSADGASLFGRASLPRWLTNAIPAGSTLKVSAAFDRTRKVIQELSLVLNPRIEGAALAAFSSLPAGVARTGPSRHPADFAMDVEAVARRVNARHMGPAGLVGHAPAPPDDAAPAGPPAPSVMMPPPPIHPGDEDEGRFLDGLVEQMGRDRAAAEIKRAIAEAVAAMATHRGPFGAAASRLRAQLRAVEAAGEGEAVRYVAPTPAELAEAQGVSVVRGMLARKDGLESLLQAAVGRLAFLRPRAARAAEDVRSLLAGLGRPGGDGVEFVRDRYHRSAPGSRAMADEVEALERSLAALPGAMAEVVAKAIGDAGGPAEVAQGLASARLLGPGADQDAEALAELASLGEQLKVLGAGPRTKGPSRAVASLQGRHDEVTAALESSRARRREAAATTAAEDVERAISGGFEAYLRLVAGVASRPDAFAESLGAALEEAPRLALERVGHGAFAGVV